MSPKFMVLLLVVLSILFYFEYMVRGAKILLHDKKIEIFPFYLFILLSAINPKKEYSYNENKHKLMAINGIFFTGVMFAFSLLFGIFYFVTLRL